MDMVDRRKNIRALQQRTFDETRTVPTGKRTRKELLACIEETLLKYDSMLINSHYLVGTNRPPERDWKSVAYFVTGKAPLAEGEMDFVFHKEDLITLRPGREHAWLDTVVSKIIRALPRRLMKWVFCQEVRSLSKIPPLS